MEPWELEKISHDPNENVQKLLFYIHELEQEIAYQDSLHDERIETLEDIREMSKSIREDIKRTIEGKTFMESLSSRQLHNMLSRHVGNPTLKEMIVREAEEVPHEY